MEEYKERLARLLAETGGLFFRRGLVLKDGRPTPYFVNMAMFRTGRLCLEMGGFFADMLAAHGLAEQTDIVLGPSYKGSAIALAASIALWQNHGREVLFEYDRKEAKTHGEASAQQSLLVNQTLFDGCRIFVVDDVATSMGTKRELLDKIAAEARARGLRHEVIGVGIAVDREQTTAVRDAAGRLQVNRRGRDAIRDFEQATGVAVYRVAGIREIVRFIHQAGIPVSIEGKHQKMDDEVRSLFEHYMLAYGVPETEGPESGDER